VEISSCLLKVEISSCLLHFLSSQIKKKEGGEGGEGGARARSTPANLSSSPWRLISPYLVLLRVEPICLKQRKWKAHSLWSDMFVHGKYMKLFSVSPSNVQENSGLSLSPLLLIPFLLSTCASFASFLVQCQEIYHLHFDQSSCSHSVRRRK
jgi:hypothetical protein